MHFLLQITGDVLGQVRLRFFVNLSMLALLSKVAVSGENKADKAAWIMFGILLSTQPEQKELPWS